MYTDHLCIFLSITPLWLLLKQHPRVSQIVDESRPYLAADYSGVRGNMYTVWGLAFTITLRQETHNICSQKLFLNKGSSLGLSVTWQWPPGRKNFTWKPAGFAHGSVGHPSYLTCWTLKVTSVTSGAHTSRKKKKDWILFLDIHTINPD